MTAPCCLRETITARTRCGFGTRGSFLCILFYCRYCLLKHVSFIKSTSLLIKALMFLAGGFFALCPTPCTLSRLLIYQSFFFCFWSSLFEKSFVLRPKSWKLWRNSVDLLVLVQMYESSVVTWSVAQLAPIKHAKWDPSRTRLALCTGSRTVCLWSPQGADCLPVRVLKCMHVYAHIH
jgi:hypothetical protein